MRATRAASDVLPESQARTLGVLEREGESSIAHLARARGIRHQSMRITIEELERRGAVRRRRDPSDARGFLIRLTDDGRALVAAERERRASSIAAAIDSGLTPVQRHAVGEVCMILDTLTATIRQRRDSSTSA